MARNTQNNQSLHISEGSDTDCIIFDHVEAIDYERKPKDIHKLQNSRNSKVLLSNSLIPNNVQRASRFRDDSKPCQILPGMRDSSSHLYKLSAKTNPCPNLSMIEATEENEIEDQKSLPVQEISMDKFKIEEGIAKATDPITKAKRKYTRAVRKLVMSSKRNPQYGVSNKRELKRFYKEQKRIYKDQKDAQVLIEQGLVPNHVEKKDNSVQELPEQMGKTIIELDD